MERALDAVVQHKCGDRNRFRRGWIEWVEGQEAVHEERPLIFGTLQSPAVEVEEHHGAQKRKALEEHFSLVDSLAILRHHQSRHLHRHLSLGHVTSKRLCALLMMRCRCRSPHHTRLPRPHCRHQQVVWALWHHESHW